MSLHSILLPSGSCHLCFPTKFICKGKVTGPVWPRRWVEVKLYSFMTVALEGGEWSAARPDSTLPRVRLRTHFSGGWVGPRAGLDGRKTSSPPVFYFLLTTLFIIQYTNIVVAGKISQ